MSYTYIQKHRRGTTEQWQASDIILEDGEIAIEDCGGGRRGLLIGDGVRSYAELPKIYLHEVMTKITTINLLAANWVGSESPYSQQVLIDGITEYSKIDLQPTPEILAYLQDYEINLTTANIGGVVTVYAIGDCPDQDLQIQATVSEVKATT